MKDWEQARDLVLNWDVVKPSSRLCLNSLDFSDLWEEEDPDAEEDHRRGCDSLSNIPGLPTPPLPPPLPPLPPPLSSPSVPSSLKSNTLRLHWRELLSLPALPRATRFGTRSIWAELEPVQVDPDRLQQLFESKVSGFCATSASTKRLVLQKQPCVSVLGVKRSNIVTIALSSLPPPHLLPPAIYSMDCTVLDREDIQRLQSIQPTEEELSAIREAQSRAPHSPLAPAELCLLSLGSMSHLSTRLQLWAFALDYDSMEREIAEPLFHLKLAMEQLSDSKTFRWILATVLAIGNFLNGRKARGFELSYLCELSRVRDTHCRQPLLLHVCTLLLHLYPQSSDLYSDITAVTRAGKCDYSLVQSNLSQLEALCKASGEQLRVLDKADERRGVEARGTSDGTMRPKLQRLLKESDERLSVLRAVHRRVINRFHSFLLFLGYSRAMVRDTRPEDFCKTISDFSLEFRATRQTILHQREKEKEKERKGTGSSTPVGQRRSQTLTQDCDEQYKLEEILKTAETLYRLDVTLPRNRRRKTDGQDDSETSDSSPDSSSFRIYSDILDSSMVRPGLTCLI